VASSNRRPVGIAVANWRTILSLVSCRLGVAFVSSATRWRCPASVEVLPVTDLTLPLPLALIWRKDNTCSKNRGGGAAPAGSGSVCQTTVKDHLASINKELATARERLAHYEAQLGRQELD